MDRAKEFEYLRMHADPLFEEMARAIVIVREFIARKGLILYGGTAIDYALRLKGDRIYPDELDKVADLDAFSPNNVADAYELADELYAAGFEEVRVINALHVETMRVDIGHNHWVSDLSYRPREIFDMMPRLEYKGMLLLHPDFQRVDLHSSLAFPYDNAPREVIFDRWSKDIKRFNLLTKYYSIQFPKGFKSPLKPVKVPEEMRKYVMCGFAAYALMYSEYLRVGGQPDAAIPPVPMKYENSTFIFDGLNGELELCLLDPSELSSKLESVSHYERNINLVPEKWVGNYVGDLRIVVYSTQDRLMTTVSVQLGGRKVRIPSVQFMLMYFLGQAQLLRKDKATYDLYIAHYLGLMRMIDNLAAADIEDPVFSLSIKTYGDKNISMSLSIILNIIRHVLDGVPQYSKPTNYRPAVAKKRGISHPVFDPETNIFFRESGRKID